MRYFHYFQALALCLVTSCANLSENGASPDLSSSLTTSDNKQLALQAWNPQAKPETVLIALHGLQGASRDFRILGRSLAKKAPATTLYALNLRGAGYDPSQKERGDIVSTSLWKSDLIELHGTLRRRHPEARIFWIGESMGSQIVLHTAATSPKKPAGLILVSPVVSLDSIPDWQVNSLGAAAVVAPKTRVSLETLAEDAVEGTANEDSLEEIEDHPHYIENYTLRYLDALKEMTEGMNEQAKLTSVPTLILYGGEDFLIEDSDIARFSKSFPNKPRVALFKSSDHLLFAGKQKNKVVSEILAWTSQDG